MGPYTALFVAGFKRQATYRGALAAGLAANVFFGIFRTVIFLTLYRNRDTAGGLDVADALTYVWVIQTLFGVIFTPWMWEWPESVRAGNFVVELLRPGDTFGRLLAADVGRASFLLAVRGLPMLVLPGLFVDLRLPTTVPGWAAVAITFALATAAAFELRFFAGAVAFWSPDFRAWWSFQFSALWILGGMVVPVEMFPGVLRWLAAFGPLGALMAIPTRVVRGDAVLASLAVQAAWVVVLALAARALMARAERTLVVHGG